jgi:hypothetical protein
MRKYLWLVVVLVVVGGVAVVPSLRGAEGQDQDEALRLARGKAFEEGGLRAAAGISGSVRQTMNPHGERDAPSLEFLVKNSRLIVIGQTRHNRGWLNKAGTTITTDYEIAVERTLKGNVMPGDLITMSVLGGRVRFPEGTWAQIDTPGMVPLFNNQAFILFLEDSDFGPSAEEKAAAHGKIYMPAFGSRGMFLIDGGVINPKVYNSHPFARKYGGKAETVLINDVLDILDRPGVQVRLRIKGPVFLQSDW